MPPNTYESPCCNSHFPAFVLVLLVTLAQHVPHQCRCIFFSPLKGLSSIKGLILPILHAWDPSHIYPYNCIDIREKCCFREGQQGQNGNAGIAAWNLFVPQLIHMENVRIGDWWAEHCRDMHSQRRRPTQPGDNSSCADQSPSPPLNKCTCK